MRTKQSQETSGEPQNNAVENNAIFYSYAAFAKRLGTCTTTVRRMCARGELRRVIINSRLIRIPHSELARLEFNAL